MALTLPYKVKIVSESCRQTVRVAFQWSCFPLNCQSKGMSSAWGDRLCSCQCFSAPSYWMWLWLASWRHSQFVQQTNKDMGICLKALCHLRKLCLICSLSPPNFATLSTSKLPFVFLLTVYLLQLFRESSNCFPCVSTVLLTSVLNSFSNVKDGPFFTGLWSKAGFDFVNCW